MSSADIPSRGIDYIRDNPRYIDVLKRIIDYENNNKQPDHAFIGDTDYDSYWTYKDVKAEPQTLYQLEKKGVLDRVFDSNSQTAYTLVDRDRVEEIVENLDDSDEKVVKPVRHGEHREIYFEFPKSEEELPNTLFENIVGLDRKKWIIKRGLTTDKITNFLLLGPAGTAKSVFLLSMFEHFKESEYVVASEASSAGVLDELFNQLPRMYLVDEFDDMSKEHQSVFASYTETGILKETKSGKRRKVETNIKTFGAANDRSKIKNNIFDRFTVLEFEPYTESEFREICEGLLPDKENKTEEQARAIADVVWDYKGVGDVRTAIQVARLSRGDPQKVIRALDEG